MVQQNQFIKTENSQAYLIGGGIASLSSAVFLIKEGFPAKNIHVLEKLAVTGGSMDAHGTADQGYLMRGGRMFDQEAYTCLWSMLENIPSLTRPGNNCKQDIFEFSKEHPTCSRARLIDGSHEKLDVSHLGVSLKDSAAMSKLIIVPESLIDGKVITDYFTSDFFHSNFWNIFCTTFAFQPWHSLIELKRYMKRFLHEVPRLNDLSGVWRTILNQYDSIIYPTEMWLREQGVQFEFGVIVKHLDFAVSESGRAVDAIHLSRNGTEETISVSKHDLVFTTLGSLTAAATVGSMTAPAPFDFEKAKDAASWNLWKDIAKRQPDFGNPEVFYNNPSQSAFESFSITFKDSEFIDRVVEWSGNQPGTGALVTFRDSKWFMSIVIPYQPHFANQPEGVTVLWGYGLKLDQVGDCVPKTMPECSGAEILTELCHHLQFEDILESTLKKSICLPAMLPYTMAQFMPRHNIDRPKVVPEKSINFAFLGQFVEVPDDVVFTVEYSVRCAMTAVYKLLGSDKEVLPIYKGWTSPANMLESAKALLH